MKIIHTADIHLDSPLVGVADSRTRRAELLRALAMLADYATNNRIAAVLVAGDLFDDKFVAESTILSVAKIINGCPTNWFVLRGNHGDKSPYDKLKALCRNAVFFGDEWQTYRLQNVAITARELGSNDAEQWQKLRLDKNFYNILMLHGDVDDDSYGLIDKNKIAELLPDYVALGHRHSFSRRFFGRAKGCYSGVLEARGFDETEPTGFVVIDTDCDKISFVPQAIRRVETVNVDVTSALTNMELAQRIIDSISGISTENYLNLQFVGSLGSNVSPLFAAHSVLDGKFFALRLSDLSQPDVDIKKLSDEVSLRGEFVKLAMQIEDEEERESVLKTGIAALSGEL